MRDFLDFLIAVVFPVLLFVAVIFFGLDRWGASVCNNYELQTGIESEYKSFDTCYVKPGDEWLRWSTYENTVIARDGLKAK